jgi:hypothetical protein
MKKIVLISSISVFVLAGLISFLVLSANSVTGAEVEVKYVAAKSGLNMRSKPDKSSSVVTLIPFGAKVTIEKSDGNTIFLDGRYGKWVNVKHGNKTGWLFGGFLCDFEPSAIIKPVADFYRNENRNDKFSSEHKKLTHFKDSEVSIVKIIDNYILLEIPTSYHVVGNVIWEYDAKEKKFFESLGYTIYNTTHLFYLDDDKYLDFVIAYGCCSGINIDYAFGSEDGFIRAEELYTSYNYPYSYMTEGSCGEVDLVFCHYNFGEHPEEEDPEMDGVMVYSRLNCKTKKFEEYKTSKIIDAKGIVSSVDWANMSIVIKDNKDLKDVSYKISDRYKSGRNFYLLEDFNATKEKLKKGKSVSFAYTILDGKRIFLGISRK